MFQSIHFESTGRKTTNASQPEVIAALKEIVGEDNVIVLRRTASRRKGEAGAWTNCLPNDSCRRLDDTTSTRF